MKRKIGIGAVAVAVAVAAFSAKLFSTVFPPVTKTYSEYVREVLAAGAIERLAHKETEEIRAALGPSSDLDWHDVEAFLSTCVRSEMDRWITTDAMPV